MNQTRTMCLAGLVLGLPLLVSGGERKAAKPAATIISPRQDSEVKTQAELIARLDARGWPIVLVRSATAGSLWWVQGPPRPTSGATFKCPLLFGNDQTPPGSGFEMVVLVAASSEDAARLQRGAALSELPDLPCSERLGVVLQRPPPAKGQRVLDAPRPMSIVGATGEVAGTLPYPAVPIVVVQPQLDNSRWWVQQPARSGPRGKFRATVRFGSDKTPPGTTFRIVVLLATPEQARSFQRGAALAKLPEDMPHSEVVPVVYRSPAPAPPRRRTMWLWKTNELLASEAAWNELFQFCRQQGIGQLWMQLPYQMRAVAAELPVAVPPAGAAEAERKVCSIEQPQKLGRFLGAAHRQGLRVAALDGYPEYSLREFHAVPLAIVDAVLAFNQAAPPDQRFDGIHLDNEPYLLVGWHNRRQREAILLDWLDLNVACQRRVDRQAGVTFGVDIPFWWHLPDEQYGGAIADVTFDGVRKPASHHVLELLDVVGVMNYRDRAGGPDGMIALGEDLLQYAQRSGRAQVLMGVETFHRDPMGVWFAVGLDRAEFQRRIDRGTGRLERLSRWRNLRLRTLDDGRRVHVGIELPADETKRAEDVRAAMGEVASRFGAAADSGQSLSAAELRQLRKFLAADGQWTDFESRLVVTGETEFEGFVARSHMSGKTTFGDDTLLEFREQVATAETRFTRYESFGGTAIHCYESFRRLVAETR